MHASTILYGLRLNALSVADGVFLVADGPLNSHAGGRASPHVKEIASRAAGRPRSAEKLLGLYPPTRA